MLFDEVHEVMVMAMALSHTVGLRLGSMVPSTVRWRARTRAEGPVLCGLGDSGCRPEYSARLV